MFESITRRERPGVARVAVVVAATAVAFGAQLVLFAGVVAKPLAVAVAGMNAPPPQVSPADLPEFEEEILVVAPYRPRRVLHARATPSREDVAWTAPQYRVATPSAEPCPAR